MELKDTVWMMKSNDYRLRLQAEYLQLKIRVIKLASALSLMNTDTKQYQLMKAQHNVMLQYQTILLARLEDEDINLDFAEGFLIMTWYKVEETDSYKRLTGKLFIIATKHKVLGGIKYFVVKPIFRWRDWWWQDINDGTLLLIHKDDMYSIFSPLNF